MWRIAGVFIKAAAGRNRINVLGPVNAITKEITTMTNNRSSNDRETWHDHGSYPRADNLDFYLSYHSMLVVAARPIEKMPVIKTREWSDEEPWFYWLSRHLLTRPDGKWLSDCRNPVPLNRPLWISEEKKLYGKLKLPKKIF